MAVAKNDDRYQKVIELYLEGTNISDISRITTVTRTTIYKILDDPFYKTMIDTRLQEIKVQSQNKLKGKLSIYLNELEKLAMTSDNENTKKDCLFYLTNRILGTPTAKTQDITEVVKDKVNQEDMLDEFGKFTLIAQ